MSSDNTANLEICNDRDRALYDAGHRDGESCREADYSFAFREVISDEAGYVAWNAIELAEWVKARLKPEFRG